VTTATELPWNDVRRIANDAFRTSFHYAVATINEDGSPHVAPIGSLRLNADKTGFFFQLFTQRTPTNLERDPRLTILAVNSGRMFWLRSLWRGRFLDVPGFRLTATAGDRRDPTEEEVLWWERRVKPARRLKGYAKLWGRGLLEQCGVRDITVERVMLLNMGGMGP